MDWLVVSLLLLTLPSVADAAAGDFESDSDLVARGARMSPGKEMDGMAHPFEQHTLYTRYQPTDAYRIKALANGDAFKSGALMSMWPIEQCQTVVVCNADPAAAPGQPHCRPDNTARFQPARYEVQHGGSTYRFGLPLVRWLREDTSTMFFYAWPLSSQPVQWNSDWMHDRMVDSTAIKVSVLDPAQDILVFTSSPYCHVRFVPSAGGPIRQIVQEINHEKLKWFHTDTDGVKSSYDISYNRAKPEGKKRMPLRAFSTTSLGANLKTDMEEFCCPSAYVPPDLNYDWGSSTDSIETKTKSAYVNSYTLSKVTEQNDGSVDLTNSVWKFRSFRLELTKIDSCEWIKLCLDDFDSGVCNDEWSSMEIHPPMNMFIPFDSSAMREFAMPINGTGFLRFTFPLMKTPIGGEEGVRVVEMGYGHVSTTQYLFSETMVLSASMAKVGGLKKRVNVLFPSLSKCNVRIAADYDSFPAMKQAPSDRFDVLRCDCFSLSNENNCNSRECW